jgi:hypothetical protein
MAEEKSLFDDAVVSEEVGTPTPAGKDEAPEDDDEAEVTVSVQDESPAARLRRLGEKKEANGRTLTIKSYSFTKPKVVDQDGNTIPPKETLKDQKKYYPGKLVLKFEEDSLIEYYPNFHYFVMDNGKVNMTAKVNRGGDNEVSKLFRMVVGKMGKPADEVSDKEFFDYLVGKKVKVQTVKGTFKNKAWFRNDVIEIL